MRLLIVYLALPQEIDKGTLSAFRGYWANRCPGRTEIGEKDNMVDVSPDFQVNVSKTLLLNALIRGKAVSDFFLN